MSFLLKSYSVTLDHYGSGRVFAKGPSQARARAFASFRDEMSLVQFSKLVRSIRLVAPPDGFGQEILAFGKPAYKVDATFNGAYVPFVWPDETIIQRAHPSDVQEVM